MAEKIEGFYLDGTEYEFGGGGAEYNAGKGISIGEGQICTMESDRKGPCPSGFHIPNNGEWVLLGDILDSSLSISSEQISSALHICLTDNSDLAPSFCSTSINTDEEYLPGKIFTNAVFLHNAWGYNTIVIGNAVFFGQSYYLCIRAFKNSYETPDSTWTVVQGTLGSSGIFWNQSKGLISITDGTNKLTIMDKNLGATELWNYGDEPTQANSGYKYQYGNNYGFPFSGPTNISNTQIDASGYGPGNYYESDIARVIETGSYNWDSSNNTNLWGNASNGIYWECGEPTDNVISNEGVLSVNGQTGYVTINYTSGNGIDITNNEIGLDGTYNKTIQDYSVMRGPAPSGFHIPSSDEWYDLYEILTRKFRMEDNPTTMGTYLKMPMAGYRNDNNASVTKMGSYGSYWSSTPYTTQNAAYTLSFDSTWILARQDESRARALSIRCFKDTPIIPTSSWTTLYDGSSVATGAGVFYNSTDGLISVSGDGTTWYTIQDKNLGATTVFNQGDTLTDANCGYFYQRGNNYGFAHSGTVTTSSTKVNASGYGPGNYYNSSTFITTSVSPSDRSSVQNDNLWGGLGMQVSGALAIGDKLYKIIASTTAPSSGTPSNIITIVTD